jgi:Holliday junction resolvase RusA-like endonuclease
MPHRPDKDNLEKFIYDTMTQANVWLDDCQVVDSHVQKRYLNYNYDKEPYTEIIFQDLSLLDQYVQGDSYESNKRRHQ